MRNGSCRKKLNNSSAGFTLLEVVLSIAILAVVSLPLLRYFLESLRYSVIMSQEQQAMFLAQEITEGILAEHRLVEVEETVDADGNPTGVKYSIPFFDGLTGVGGVGDFSTKNLIEDGTGEAVYKTTLAYGEGDTNRYDGSEHRYDVEVTVKTSGSADDVSLKDMLDLRTYGIYSDTDVMYTDSGENDRAVLEFLGINYAYCLEHRDDDVQPEMRDDVYIRKNMRREIYVDLSVESNPVDANDQYYRIVVYYVYYCPGIEGGGNIVTVWPEKIIPSADPGAGSNEDVQVLVVVNRTMKELRNIFLLYDWCEGGDTVILGNPFRDDDGKEAAMNSVVARLNSQEPGARLGLNVVYQTGMNSGDPQAGTDGYKLKINRDSFKGNLSVYTNVGSNLGGNAGNKAGELVGTDKYPLNAFDTDTQKLLFLGEGESALVYDIVTKVYPEGHQDGTDPLVVIETKKGE